MARLTATLKAVAPFILRIEVNMKNHITQNELKELFTYDNGNLIWNVKRGKAKVGAKAGYKEKDGYIRVRIYSKNYPIHRLIYIYYFGDFDSVLEIDHINRIRDDNRIENLRLTTNQENQFNRNAKGCSFEKRLNKYKAQIKLNGKSIHIGRYDTQEEAHNAYKKAKLNYHIIRDR